MKELKSLSVDRSEFVRQNWSQIRLTFGLSRGISAGSEVGVSTIAPENRAGAGRG